MAATLDELLAGLPHASPFRFVSRINEFVPAERAEAVWKVDGHEEFFQGHFPGNPLVPGVLLIEAMAQVSGLVAARLGDAMTNDDGGAGRLAHADVRFLREVNPPAEIVLTSAIYRVFGRLFQFAVEANVQGEPVARGMVTVAMGFEGDAQEAAT